MIRHIVMWNFLEQVPQEQRAEIGKELKASIEALADIIEGVQQLQVEIVPMGTSSHDILLDSTFNSMEALDQYQSHHAHVSVAQRLREVAGNRSCFDYEV